jgi:hypothetical protein
MIVLCIGMQRSASTWSFNVCRILLERLSGAIYGGFHANLEQVVDLDLESRNAVIKSHETGAVARDLILNGGAHAVYTHRDVYDAVASQMQMFSVTFDDALDQIGSSLIMAGEYFGRPNFLAVSYSNILDEPRATVEGIASFLGLQATSQVVAEIVRANSLTAMKEAADALNRKQSATANDYAYDAITLLHPSHIRNGSRGYGREHLSEEQQDAVTSVMAALPPNAYALYSESTTTAPH